jgi:hypothetical protein
LPGDRQAFLQQALRGVSIPVAIYRASGRDQRERARE